ncbi:hypothetical protein P153DRAFT_85630 [Dothidotthia symphoricarpi CBS 119687]|uniref:Uncharacterized protein n=1 Tax=Dothidotthia symphoricarpi CBS 119687 TaxID=1392245 RepID=A0A6A6A4N1_9PLEO|nr:uncharacterized protein P153DRAFT_85630 [Dothidotthia symphoricarpi CBS 119687]KAF2126123.1 hypothetical protein P153DRAFT_85630 [Dothidotthia symphoricarpi CBS 119687]
MLKPGTWILLFVRTGRAYLYHPPSTCESRSRIIGCRGALTIFFSTTTSTTHHLRGISSSSDVKLQSYESVSSYTQICAPQDPLHNNNLNSYM